MFRFLFKLCVSLVALIAIAWFGTTVPLGSRTLFGHLHAISETKESRELVDGTKHAAGPIVDDVKRRIGHGDDKSDKADKSDRQARLPPAPPESSPAQDDFSPSERRQLRRLLGAAEHHASLK